MGSSGGGGGSSGAVSYPAYMEGRHSTWLTDIDTLIDTALANSPYVGASAYNPDCVLNATNVILSQFNDVVIALDPTTDWSTFFDSMVAKYSDYTFSTITEYSFTDPFSDAEITANIAAHSAEVSARITNEVLPAYKIGMQNINAVMTSAFTIGSALITAQGTRDVNKYGSDLRLTNQKNKLDYEGIKANSRANHNQNLLNKDKLSLSQKLTVAQFGLSGAEMILKYDFQEAEYYKAVAALTADANRIKIVAKKEQVALDYEYDELDAKWGLDLYKHGAAMMASISGGVPALEGNPSKGQSMLGGALSGAAAGAMISPTPMGVGIGALLGGLSSLI